MFLATPTADPTRPVTPIRLTRDARTYLLSAPNAETTPKLARDFVRALLRSAGHRELVDSAMLLTSEAVTNCHAHGTESTDILLRTLIAPHGVRVSVHDDHRPHSHHPTPTPPPPTTRTAAACT